MPKTLFILFESAPGYALFERKESEEIGDQLEQVQKAIQEFGSFSSGIKLKSFIPFPSAEVALENANDNAARDKLLVKGKSALGVGEEKLASAIQEATGIECQKNAMILELLRGIRLHFDHFVDSLKEGGLDKAQRGLGHSYSRAKVKFNVHRVDNMILHSIALLDQLDKDLNTFAMRAREWYSWHFPELSPIISDSPTFARALRFIGDKGTLSEERLPELSQIVKDPELAQKILEAARASMGTDLSPIDLLHIQRFADRVIQLSDYRTKLHEYLSSKMGIVAPNLTALVGESVGARLISHAGSLTNLAKYPASTVQILGAEKALFRALKTKGKTPKYGLIFQSSFIGRASLKNKGRISRFLANKCSIASRIDCFSDYSTQQFGIKLKEQMEERLQFYATGQIPTKNAEAMKAAASAAHVDEVAQLGDGSKKRKEAPESDTPKKKKKKSKKEKEEKVETPKEETPKKDKKKEKKAKKAAKEDTPQETETTPKKKKDKKKKQ